MGIFSRLFQRGQDGSPPEGGADDEDGEALSAALASAEAEEPDIMLTPAMAAAAASSVPAATTAPAAAPALPNPPALPGLTPAFAAESPRSMWEWPGAARDPRRTPSAPAAAASSPGDEARSQPESSEPRTPSRAGALPSVPRTQSSPTEQPPRTGEPAKERDVQNATMILSPPPAPPAAKPPTMPPPPRPAARSAAPSAPQPPAPQPAVLPSPAEAPAPGPPATATAAGRPARRAHSDSIASAFDLVIDSRPDAGPADGVSTAEDLAEVRRLFHDVAVSHVSQVRDVMLELRYGDAQASWIESTQPALRSLRAMAEQMELTDLCAALDEFCVAVDGAVEGRARIDDAGKAALLGRYQRLIELIPQAFELDAERDRREPIIVEALLYQIEGVEKRTVEKLFAVGLSRLEALLQATADEIAVVAGIRQDLSEAIVEQFRTYKVGANAALSAPDPLAERRALGDLLIMLSVQNDEYNHAATKWSDDARARKRDARKQRDHTFQRIKVALARLGERDQLARLEKLPFDERIAALDRYLSAAAPPRLQPGKL